MKKTSKETKIVLIIAFFSILSTFLIGVHSDLYLGDEIFHFRIAKSYYYEKTRPIYDKLIHTNDLAKTYYIEPMLWHYILALIWRLNGDISIPLMQIYQSSWVIIKKCVKM
jgi:hypothetical protein